MLWFDWIFGYNELPKYMNWIVEKKLKGSKFVSEIIIESLNKFKNELEKK